MKKPMLVFLAVFACAALAGQAVRAADPPDLKETLKWLKRYVNEEAGGQFGPDLPADAPSKATGPGYSFSYKWIDKAWTSADEATADAQLSLTDRSTDEVTKYTASLKLKGIKLDGLSVGPTKVFEGSYYLKIPVNEAVTITKNGAPVEMDDCYVLFATEAAANKAMRALRRAATLAGAGDVADPFASDPPKNPVVSRPDPPVTTPPPPDDKATRGAELDAQIADAEAAVSDGEQKLSDLEGKILGAKVAVAAADAAYQKAESGSGQEFLAETALAVAEGVRDDLISQKDAVQSDLKADRDRLNQLKRERARLGN